MKERIDEKLATRTPKGAHSEQRIEREKGGRVKRNGKDGMEKGRRGGRGREMERKQKGDEENCERLAHK